MYTYIYRTITPTRLINLGTTGGSRLKQEGYAELIKKCMRKAAQTGLRVSDNKKKIGWINDQKDSLKNMESEAKSNFSESTKKGFTIIFPSTGGCSDSVLN